MTLLKTADPDWVALHRIADQMEPRVQQAFLNALQSMRDQFPLGAMTEALEARNITAAMKAAGVTLPPNLTRDITRALTDLTMQAAEVTELSAAFNLDFTLVNPQAVAWAEAHVGELITQVGEETKTAVRRIVSEGIREGRAPRVQARQIQRIVGLTERDALAVNRRLAGLLESGASLDYAEKQANRYTRKLLRQRAEMIARTETMTASNQGQKLLWDRAATDGLLDTTAIRRVWIATSDSRVCARCASLDEKTIAFEGKYTEAVESAPKSGVLTVETPPLHPRCRCAEGLVEVEMGVEEQPRVTPESLQETPRPDLGPDVLTDDQWEFMDPSKYGNRRGSWQGDSAVREAAFAATEDGRLLAEAADQWVDGLQLTRMRNGVKKLLGGGPVRTRGERKLDTLLRALRQTKIESPDTLWRGIAVKGDAAEAIERLAKGSRFDINLSSFTSSDKVARQFARDNMRALTAKKRTEVVFKWTGDAKQTLPVQNIQTAPKAFGDREWIGAGRFEVVDVKKTSSVSIIVEIAQVAGL